MLKHKHSDTLDELSCVSLQLHTRLLALDIASSVIAALSVSQEIAVDCLYTRISWDISRVRRLQYWPYY